MDNATVQKLKDLILKNQDIAVVVKQNPNLDEMAAGLGLYLILKQMGKNAVIACATTPIVALSSLVGIDKVQNSLGGGVGGDLTVSFPYKEGEIEKVSYTLDNGLLNIVVKAGEKGLSFQQSDVKFVRGGKTPTLIFYVGVPTQADAGALFTSGQGITIVNIDNKEFNQKYGDMVIVDPKWSSVSEQIADFVTLLEPQVEVDKDTAQNLLAGISFSTEDFQSTRTSYLAFEVAGILMKKGATRQRAKEIATNSGNAQPTPAEFFPPASPMTSQGGPVQTQPQRPVQPVQQPYNPVVTPRPNPVQPQPWQQPQPFNPAPVVQQPVAPVQTQSVGEQPVPVQQPVQTVPVQPVQSASPKQTPPDWLTPKVYKGSTVL